MLIKVKIEICKSYLFTFAGLLIKDDSKKVNSLTYYCIEIENFNMRINKNYYLFYYIFLNFDSGEKR